VFINSKKKIYPINLSVEPDMFDKEKQRVNLKHKNSKYYNIIIEKFLADINTIEVNYRLSDAVLDIDKLTHELLNPSSWICFVKFWEEAIEQQKGVLKASTYRQQLSSLVKLKEFRNTLYFYELNKPLIDELEIFLKTVKKNQKNTVSTFFKNFKKYLNLAQDRGIKMQIKSTDIVRTTFKSDRVFLMPEEIEKLYKYWKSEFILDKHKNILSRFLFSCFTGLRISDIQNINSENIVSDFLVFVSQKTNKLQRIQLNKSAQLFINDTSLFNGTYSDEFMNRELKDICKICKIYKSVSYHVSRHTFATNFLISGGKVEVLQKILGHSKIENTMIYVHIAESITNVQILNMDNILNN
jgi:site-specific recombinase XerD